jgi:predicted Fe-S protein YdhL (DUF1289 family)
MILPTAIPDLCRIEPRMADIETPCNKVCVVDPVSARCIGCGRTLAEIAGWSAFTPEERRRIMTELAMRPQRAKPAS